MRTTTYKCNRCKNEVLDGNELIPIKLYVGASTQYGKPDHETEWCKTCIVETGMKNWIYGVEVTPPEVTPTVEQLLKELLQNMIYEEVQEAVKNV